MNDNKEQIEEMAKVIRPVLENRVDIGFIPDLAKPIAQELLNYYQPKIAEGLVVISKEEYEDLRMLEAKYGLPICMDGCITAYGHRLMTGERLVAQAQKQTVKEVLERIENKGVIHTECNGKDYLEIRVDYLEEIEKELLGEK